MPDGIRVTYALQRAVASGKTWWLYLSKSEQFRISNAIDTKKIPNGNLIQPARPPLNPTLPTMKDNQISAAADLLSEKKACNFNMLRRCLACNSRGGA